MAQGSFWIVGPAMDENGSTCKKTFTWKSYDSVAAAWQAAKDAALAGTDLDWSKLYY
jgi:hypothetical protein